MKATNNLRFVERKDYTEDAANPQTFRILQQWWASDPDCYEDWVLQANGEWRNVPVEKSCEK